MRYRISVITGSRADYGLLKELIKRLDQSDDFELDLVVTGSHLSGAFGNTEKEIKEDGFLSYSTLLLPDYGDAKEGMAKSAGEAVILFTDYFCRTQPAMVIVLGDRYEILGAAIAAHFLGIPIGHISGGDVTEGAVDDAIRHSITKFSNIHFPGCEQSRMRIIQMGENPEYVFNVGEPGVENCLRMPLMSRKELAENLHFCGIMSEYVVVTFHPVTMEKNTGIEQVRNLKEAMEAFPDISYIITMANADAGGREINDFWKDEVGKHKNWLLVSSLGSGRYLSALKYAGFVLGNSSSGIVEAPAMGIPTVNIGDRQKGRMMADSIISCSPRKNEIIRGIEQARDDRFREKAKHVRSPFGNGNTSERIEKHILQYLKEDHHTTEKRFYDIPFRLGENDG